MIRKTMMTLALCMTVLLAAACGQGADETVKEYLAAQQAYDAEKAASLLRESDRAGAKDALSAKFEQDKAAGNSVVSYEITEIESDSSNSVVKVRVTRTRNGKEKVHEEVYWLEKESDGWRIDKGMADFFNSDPTEDWSTGTVSE